MFFLWFRNVAYYLSLTTTLEIIFYKRPGLMAVTPRSLRLPTTQNGKTYE